MPLAELFADRSQLAVYHVMFGPGWSAPCPRFIPNSAYNRGIEELNGAFGYYDLLPRWRAW